MAKSNKNAPGTGTGLYQNKSNIKWIVLSFSIVISVSSIYYTNILVEQLKEREKQQIQLYAKAL
ncbi:MAG: histidine kinase, partial [Bacteroidota bacterium]